MSKSYFKQVPDFEYISRLKSDKSISDYITVKNLFKRGKLREEIFGNLNFFTKYSIIGDERPDNVAYKIYNDEDLDWIVLLSNNILNIQTEWPLSQNSFDKYLLEKYKEGEESDEDTYIRLYNGIHHYETIEVRNSSNSIILPKGLIVQENFTLKYFDDLLSEDITITNAITSITNYDYENKIEDDKRNIFILKPKYLNIVYNDMDKIMPYQEGSSQYLTRTLKRADNIRLFN